MNTIPRPKPQTTPPYSAAIRGSVGGKGITANASISTELKSIPSRDPAKNRLPIFKPPNMNRGRLMRMDRLPTLPKPSSSTTTWARPEMPPGFMSLGCKNKAKPRAKTVLPRTVAAIQPNLSHNLRIGAPPFVS